MSKMQKWPEGRASAPGQQLAGSHIRAIPALESKSVCDRIKVRTSPDIWAKAIMCVELDMRPSDVELVHYDSTCEIMSELVCLLPRVLYETGPRQNHLACRWHLTLA
jgi:hypothetical protein